MSSRILRGCAIVALSFAAAACPGMSAPTATFYIHNSDPTALELRITDSETCQLGMITQLNQNTRSTYDINALTGGYICVGPGATTGFPVEGDKYYMLKDGKLMEDPNPEGAHEADSGFMKFLENAGREAKDNK